MLLELVRYNGGPTATLGLLFVRAGATRELLCFTAEDAYRATKRVGETRIPPGSYRVELRDAGGMHAEYAKRFAFHRGMLWIRNVPGFQWIYLHVGNTARDTAGCVLVGEDRDESRRSVRRSVEAYTRIYPRIADAIEADDPVTIRVVDRDRVDTPRETTGRAPRVGWA